MLSTARSEATIVHISEPPLARFLFADIRLAPLWAVVRLYLGYQWFTAGWGKVTNPEGVWIGAKAGTSVAKFIEGALTKTSGEHPDVSGWYATFLREVALPNAAFFSYLVAFGEVLVGVALILGLFTGFAAFFGAVMNSSYLFAGTVSTNPVLLLLGILLILAWRVAGYWGLDRWVLPTLGVPGRPGPMPDPYKVPEANA